MRTIQKSRIIRLIVCVASKITIILIIPARERAIRTRKGAMERISLDFYLLFADLSVTLKADRVKLIALFTLFPGVDRCVHGETYQIAVT